jgi:adenosylhomocysteine nucleosidase
MGSEQIAVPHSPLPISRSPLVLFFALRREAMYFRRLVRPCRFMSGGPCSCYACGHGPCLALVLETGMGGNAAAGALQWLMASLGVRPRAILSTGFAGALDPQAQVGQLVAVTEVISEDGHAWPITWTPGANLGVRRTKVHQGRLLSASTIIADKTQKRRLGELWRAIAVDLESGALARLCQIYQIPFGCVRVISDDVETTLSPQLEDIIGGAQISVKRIVGTVARHPGLLAELCRLAACTRQAAWNLARALQPLVASGCGALTPDR